MRQILLSFAIVGCFSFGMGLPLSSSNQAVGQEIGFLEEFVLAEDREKVLQQLVPGTEEYYYYHALHYQNNQQLDKVDTLFTPWVKRFGETHLVKQMRNRQSLLKYSDDPESTLKYLQRELGLNFNHQREIPQTQRDLPTKLDPKLLATDRLIKRALSRNSNTGGFSDVGLRLLADQKLTKTQRRHLLERLRHPEYPGLVDLIISDLKERDSRGFGSMPIHQAMTLAQLGELADKYPKTKTETHYVGIYLSKLQPSDDINWRADAAAHRNYLDRLWGFVKPLNPSFNSLKASILFRRLELDSHEGSYDRATFMEYLKFPRNVVYINPTFMKNVRARNTIVNLGANYFDRIALPPVGNDEPLMREYLHHFLVSAADYKDFAPYIRDTYLKRQFATVKILNGIGDTEKWASLLSPEEYKSLLDRVDLEFVSTNPEFFKPDDDVELELQLKNVKTLIVKVFEVNSQNYYRKYKREIDTDVNLDGLVPNHEETFTYNEAPALRKKHQFKFPQLKNRGVYVVDFIAGGKSSRALIRKGRLEMFGQVTAAGQMFTVIDPSGTMVKDASLWISGARYYPEEDGRILVPFSTQPGRVNAIITQGEFSCLQGFDHAAENYKFTASLVVDRESLNRSNTGRVLIRPSLKIVGGNRVPVSLLEKQKLVITSVNQDGISTTHTIDEIEFSDDEETICEFVVPPRLKTISFGLSAELKNISRNRTENVSAANTYSINAIDQSEQIQDIHLIPSSRGYFLEFLGKSGELRVKQAVRLTLKFAKFSNDLNVDLQTDEKGLITLGSLENVASIEATPALGMKKSWTIQTQDQTYYSTIQANKGMMIEIPAPAGIVDRSRDNISLMEIRHGQFITDRFDHLSVDKGLITIKGLDPGDYQLRMTSLSTLGSNYFRTIKIRVTNGKLAGNVVVGKFRHLETRGTKVLHVSSIIANQDKVRIELENINSSTRVHVIADRYQPAFSAYETFAEVRDLEPWLVSPSIRRTVYMEGRKIGDEYEYILRRKYASKYPGNMLERPSLLLNPWAVRTTSNSSQVAAAGSKFDEAGMDADASSSRSQSHNGKSVGNHDFANLDYLGKGAVLLANLKPNKNGVITFDRSKLGDSQHVRVVAIDSFQTIQRSLDLQLMKLDPRDARLAHSLDSEKHFSQSKQTNLLKKSDTLMIDDIISAKFQQYDDLGDVFQLFKALNAGTHLSKFEFILTWDSQSDEEKQKLYSKFACHELNFFLMKKDRQFFDDVIVPHLKNKRDKTFMDQWLLRESLDAYAEPWKYARLNTMERILLSQRLEERSADMVRNIDETYLLSPISRAQIDRLYETSIRGLGLGLGQSENFKSRILSGADGADGSEGKDSLRALPKLAVNAPSSRTMRGGAMSESRAFGRGGGQGGEGYGPGGGGRGVARKRAQLGAVVAESAIPFKDSGKEGEMRLSELKSLNGQMKGKFGKQGRASRRGELEMDGRYEYGDGLSLGSNLSFDRQDQQNAVLGGFNQDLLRRLREKNKRLYRRLAPTQEWIENNYYLLQPSQETIDLVRVNRFWRDYASHTGGTFLSPCFAEANRTFTEMMFALSVLDLPLEAPENKFDYVDNTMKFTAGGPAIVLHQQVRNAVFDRGNTTILVSENFFQKNDRYRHEDGIRFDKFISGEFLAHTLYGGQVVITNPTSTPRPIELLIQIPRGSVACSGSQETRTIQLDLEAFSTKTFEYSFYFPTAGEFDHYPAHVSAEEKVFAVADNVLFDVIDRPADVDETSWEFVSQNGTEDEVIDFINTNNVLRLNLGKIAFRMKDKSFFQRAIKTLRNRYTFNSVLWSYSIKHNQLDSIQEFLMQADSFVGNCGAYFRSELLTINPVERKWYQHKEYWPLVNSRAHQLGPQRKILNPNFFSQYNALLTMMANRRELTDDDHLVVTYYMLLQDRIETALDHFGKVSVDGLPTRLQYDYCDAYLDMYRSQPEAAASTAQKWADYPVEHWRNRFKNILAQVEEIQGGATKVVDKENNAQQQTELASQSESFDFDIESGMAKLKFQNIDEVVVNYYEMDIELLFSRSPFAQDEMDGFSLIRPNLSETKKLEMGENGRGKTEFALPDALENKNILVEVVSGDQTKSEPYFAHSLDLQMLENYGQVRVSDETTGKAIPKAYVKVYARLPGGEVRFHKDGYTDLRGRFDYVSQSNRSIDGIQKFSILVLSDENGAVVRQADLPKE